MQQLKSYFHFHIPGRDQLTRSMYPRCSLNKQLRRLSRYRVVRAIHDVAQPPSVAHPVIYHPDFQLSPLPDDHRFPMPKDHLLYVRLKELGLANFTVTPAYPSPETIMMVHEPGYVRSFLEGTIATKKMRMIGLPWSETLVKRTMIGTGSAIAAARTALEQGVACTCNGGTHHAHRDYGTDLVCGSGCTPGRWYCHHLPGGPVCVHLFSPLRGAILPACAADQRL
eukprot:jgi/Botrbrau1/18622/Bobra.0367s0059.3